MNEFEQKIADNASSRAIDATKLNNVGLEVTSHDQSNPLTAKRQQASEPLKPTRTSDQNLALNLDCSLGSFPASSVEHLTAKDKGSYSNVNPDFISRGIISFSTAQEHFSFFQTNLNTYVYDILSSTDTLADIRSRSSLLALAICSTAAYCSGSSQYQTLFEAFKSEVATKLFSKTHSFDDVRALCIGAFWLSDTATALNALGKFYMLY